APALLALAFVCHRQPWQPPSGTYDVASPTDPQPALPPPIHATTIRARHGPGDNEECATGGTLKGPAAGRTPHIQHALGGCTARSFFHPLPRAKRHADSDGARYRGRIAGTVARHISSDRSPAS